MFKRTTRRQFISGAIGMAATTIAMPTHASKNKMASGFAPIGHNVYFWLKQPESKEDLAALIKGVKSLGAIESIKGMQVGVPASTAARDVVDSSFQVSLLLMFDDLDGQQTYQDHPIHLQFIKDCSALWSKVVVYDSKAV